MSNLTNAISKTKTTAMKLISCRVPEDVYAELKLTCLRNNHTMTDVVNAGFQIYIKENSKKKNSK